jgi:hypothetical protein
MTESFKKIIHVWKTVFSDWKYSALALTIAAAFFVLNVMIQNWQTLWFFLRSVGVLQFFNILAALTLGFRHTTTTTSFISIILIALMFGMFISLMTFKVKSLKTGKNIGVWGTLGIALGIAAPGCAACGVGLLAVFGLSAGALAVLPFKGLEISILAIIILGVAIWQVSKGLLECEVCKIHVKDMKGGKK